MQQADLPSAGRVREVFEQVLAGPDFEGPGTSLLGRVMQAFAEFLAAMLERWLPALSDGQIRVFSWGLLLSIVVFLAWLAYLRVSRWEGGSARVARPAEARKPRDASEWARWARDQQGAGRLRGAATGLYQAVIMHLEGRGALRYGEWKTPGDYAHEVSGDEAEAPFESFLALFVEVAFGSREPTTDSVEALFRRAERLGCPT